MSLHAAKVMKPLIELNPGKLETEGGLGGYLYIYMGIDQNPPEMFWEVRFRGSSVAALFPTLADRLMRSR